MTQRCFPSTVIVPYVKGMLRAETHRAVLSQWPRTQLVQLACGSVTAYAKLLVDLWGRPGDLVVVEQDIVPPPASIRALLSCPHLWCTHPTPYAGHDNPDMLGLARFATALKRQYPHGMEAALCRGLGNHLWPHWRSCDTLLARWLRSHGIEPHVHHPAAVHLHDAPWPRIAEGPAPRVEDGAPSDGEQLVDAPDRGCDRHDHGDGPQESRRADDQRRRPQHDAHGRAVATS